MATVIFTKSSGLNDSFFGKSQEPIKAFIENQVEVFEQNSMLDKVFTMEQSNNFAEKFTYKTKLGMFKDVGENGEYPTSTIREGYSKVIEPAEWKNQFHISKTMLEDMKMFDIKSEAIGFTDGYNRTRESFGATLLSNGNKVSATFNAKTYDTKTADGKSLFSTTHTSVTDEYVDQSNLFSDDFSYDTLCAMEQEMQNFRDDSGNLLNICPNTIIIPNDYKTKKVVFDAIGAEGIPGTNNNSFNYQFGRWNVIVWPYLTIMDGVTAGKSQIYMMDTTFNQNYEGLVWLDRLPLSVHSWVNENTDANVFNGRARFTAGFNNWRAISCLAPGLAGATTLMDSSSS